MSGKEKLFFLWFFAAVAFSFVFRHFWSSVFDVLGSAVVLNLVSLPSLLKFALVICGVQLLP